MESVSAILALKGECNSHGFYLNLYSLNEKLKIKETQQLCFMTPVATVALARFALQGLETQTWKTDLWTWRREGEGGVN